MHPYPEELWCISELSNLEVLQIETKSWINQSFWVFPNLTSKKADKVFDFRGSKTAEHRTLQPHEAPDLCNLKNLKKFRAKRYVTNSKFFDHISQLQLKKMTLLYCQINANDVHKLYQIKSLINLNIFGSQITNKLATPIPKSRAIKTLELGQVTFDDDDFIRKIIMASPAVTELSLYNCDIRTLENIPEGYLKALEVLDLKNCELTEKQIKLLVRAAPNLYTLKLLDYTDAKQHMIEALQKQLNRSFDVY